MLVRWGHSTIHSNGASHEPGRVYKRFSRAKVLCPGPPMDWRDGLYVTITGATIANESAIIAGSTYGMFYIMFPRAHRNSRRTPRPLPKERSGYLCNRANQIARTPNLNVALRKLGPSCFLQSIHEVRLRSHRLVPPTGLRLICPWSGSQSRNGWGRPWQRCVQYS
jgi:hypothetical protein